MSNSPVPPSVTSTNIMVPIQSCGTPAAQPTLAWEGMIEHRPCAVAVVDDDPEVLESFRFVLELAGFVVHTYGSAASFLASSEPAPHCLILDHHMPAMTGLELARALRARGSDVPVVLITAAPSPAIVAKASELGIVRVLEKPPSADELIRYVGSCC